MRRLLPYGADAVLVECDDGADALGLWRRLCATPVAGMREAVPGARTVLVLGDVVERDRDSLLTVAGLAGEDGEERVLVIPVRYDGADLEAVAAHCGLSTGEVVALHVAPLYRVAFGGFAPGFAYLEGLEPALVTPRLPTPRPRVPAGSVAIADMYTAVYPAASPGGWHLLGTTDHVMFDPGRDPAAALRPGMRARFERR